MKPKQLETAQLKREVAKLKADLSCPSGEPAAVGRAHEIEPSYLMTADLNCALSRTDRPARSSTSQVVQPTP
jgi:hypothetical protein